MNKIIKSSYFRFSSLLLAAGLQCYAYAGFAVNTSVGDPEAIYENQTTLVTKCISQSQAIEFYQKNQSDGYQIVFAYPLKSDGKMPTLASVSPENSFCVNPYTRKLGVAGNPKEAMLLIQSRPQVFYAIEGDTLSQTLARWAQESGYKLKWIAANDFKMEFSYTFRVPFSQALEQLLQSIAVSSSGFALQATIMKNGVVVVKENEYRAQPVIGGF